MAIGQPAARAAADRIPAADLARFVIRLAYRSERTILKRARSRVLRQFASPYFVARSPETVNVQEVRLSSRALSRLVWLATCRSTKLTH